MLSAPRPRQPRGRPVSTVRVRVRGGYEPSVLRARIGEPLRIVFSREETAPCSELVVFPAFGKSAMLPPFEDVALELVPERAGEYEFTCQMGVLHGRLIVEGNGRHPHPEARLSVDQVTSRRTADVAPVRPSLGTRIAGAALAAWGGFIGLLPHVLHHVGPLAGAALVAGATGRTLFAAIGFVATIPLLSRLYRRFRTWKAPAIALAAFAAAFSLSSFVLGPAISGEKGETPAPGIEQPTGHAAHHAGDG